MSQHKATPRDYIEERVNADHNYPVHPIQIAFGLNRFEFFQGANNFLRNTVEGILGFIPFVRGAESGYINDSLRLTRYRNFHQESI